MYKCCNIKKLIRIILCDTAMIIIALVITIAGTASEEITEPAVFLPSIMYHSIIDADSAEGDYKINVNTVENDLIYLKENGYTAVFVEDIINYVENNVPLPEKPVLITADDGFYNNYYYLLPLLEKYDMRATISIVGYYSEVLAKNDSHVPQYSYLTWEDIKKCIDSGRIEIGNHTYNMHSLSGRKGCSKLEYESEEEYEKIFLDDIGVMQTTVKMNTGMTPVVFAYPYGCISSESVPLLKKIGFSAALTCFEKPNYITKDKNCLFSINRYNRPAGMSTEKFMKKLLSH